MAALLRPALEALEGRRLMASNFAVGPNVNISEDGQNEAEQAIAVNPANPQNLFAMSTLDATKLFAAYSFDGGATWTTNGSFANGSGSLPQACCDESAVFDQYGNLFISYLNFTDDQTVVAMSTDGGKTFSELTSFGTNDQPKIAIGPGGSAAPESVWIEYLDTNNLIAAQGAPVTGLGKVGSFTGQVEASDSGGGNFGKLSIGPKGQVAISYEMPENNAGPASLFCAVDPNGLTNPSFNASTVISSTNVGGFAPIPPQPQRTIDAEVGLAYDYTGGPHNGRLYAVYTNSPGVNSSATDIFERHSDDNGATWSAPVKVTDDTSGAPKFMPRIAVDAATGNVGVSWLDTRNGGGVQYESFLTVSLDGGQTFLPNVQVAANPSDAITAGGNDNSGFDTGDYSGLTFYDNVLYPVWSDNSPQLANNPNNNFDLATAQVTLLTLNAHPVPIAGAEGQAFSGKVATFSDNAPGLNAASFTANIDWGDGNTGVGTIAQQPDGSYVVSGSNTYTEGGTYNVTVTITDPSNNTATAVSTATIADAPLIIKLPSTPPAVIEGQAAPVLLATLTDADPNPTFASNYTPTITLPDGTTATGVVKPDPIVSGQYDIYLTQTLEEGQYPLKLSVVDNGGATATLNITLNVTDAPLTPVSQTGTAVSGTAGQAFSTILGSFTDAYSDSFPEDFTAQVNWDGTHTTYVNVIEGDAPGLYDVVGGFAYPKFGTYNYAININDVGGAQTTINGTATIADAQLQAGVTAPLKAVEGVAAQGVVANFSTFNAAAVPGQFQATINWGDGSVTPGTVTGSAGSGFQVLGGHAYAEDGSYPIVVSIQSTGGGSSTPTPGSSLTINNTAVVADAPLGLGLVPVQVYEQTPFNVAVATFTDPNLKAPLSDFNATIAWGDGTSSPGTITPQGAGLYVVTGAHTYATDTSYPISVSVGDAGGSSANGSGTVTPVTVIVPVTGTISPASITSRVPGAPVTRITTPTFFGHAAPGSTVQLFAVNGSMAAPLMIGSAPTDAAGNWLITSQPIADGVYGILAASADAAGKPNSPLVGITGLYVDTVAPRILNAALNPAGGQLSVTYIDTGVGIDTADIFNPAAYSLTLVGSRGTTPITLMPQSVTPGSLPGTFTATFSIGHVSQGSTYNLTINSAAITDWAGNPLDGAFGTNFPTGNGVPGSVFQGQFVVFGTAPVVAQQPLPPADLNGAQIHENLIASRTPGRRRRR